jgi:hypothetical protein
MTMIYILYTITLITSAFLWLFMHELSHISVANIFVDVYNAKIKLYPHFFEHNGKRTLRFASVSYNYYGDYPTGIHGALINLAPRFMNILAALLFPLGLIIITPWLQMCWFIFWGAGLVDFLWGSIGTSEQSDIMKASKNLKINHMIIRLISFLFIMISASIVLL